MENKLKSNIKIRNLLDNCNNFYLDLLGYKPESTKLINIENSNWNNFTKSYGLSPNSYGAYLPRNQAAIIKGENPLSLLHEYFGHGLYCEKTLSGQKLVNLEQKLLKEEKENFGESKFTLEDIKSFRENNKTFNELTKFRENNLAKYELFAIWTEYLLSNKNGLEDKFERKYNGLNPKNKEIVDSTINFNKQYGDLATFWGFDLRKIQDKKRLSKLSKDVFKEKLNRTKLILHFGSGKCFSDVDLFIISNDISSFYNNWIDIRSFGLKDIKNQIELLNPKAIYPIIENQIIFGENDYLNQLKEKISSQKITKKSIEYNLKMSEYHRKISKDNLIRKHWKEKNLRSSKIYLTNALALREGLKILTFKELINYSNILSKNKKFIELKGGIQ